MVQHRLASAAVIDRPDEGSWELLDGLVREKPGMGMEHIDMRFYLALALAPQLDAKMFRIRINSARLRLPSGSYDISESWSRSTGDYDVDAKLPDYRLRGDREVWRLHPYEHRLTAWRRQDDGEYSETLSTGGVAPVVSPPGVEVDLDALFAIRNR